MGCAPRHADRLAGRPGPPIAAFAHADDLVEEYSGFGVRVETRKLGTERLGASFVWSRFDQDWRDQTRAALASNGQVAGLYETRSTITPLVRFAITPRLRVSGGVSIVALDPLDTGGDPSASSTMANAVVGALGYRLRLADTDDPGHDVSALFTVRSATEALDDLEKPLARDRVLLAAKNAIERSDLQRENQRFREPVGDSPAMIGQSVAFRQAIEDATQVARSDVSVLLQGESGTGKELLAAHIHRESTVAPGPS